MEINWVTFLAQIVNFFVLVFVLQRLLYKPIIKAMERREKTIRDRLQSAEQQQQQAKEESSHYQQMQADFSAQKAELLAQAKIEVEQTRQQLLQAIENESILERSRWQASLRRQKLGFLQEVRYRTIQQLQIILRLILQDLAGVMLEKQIVEIFLKRLQNLSDSDRFVLVSTVTQTANNDHIISLTLVSAFDLPEEMRAVITEILQNYFNQLNLGDVHLDYEIQPDLICGLELHGTGYKLTWSIESYLNSMTEHLDSILAEEIGIETLEKVTENHG